MKFPGYFLIVADFIQWAKANGIPVGPGRGSGAGSVVAWSLTITDLDPLRFGLLFERFLNPERVSMPDFDIDFCQDRRDEVIRYVQKKYGADRVAQIITHGKLQARAVLRDVGRVLQMPYGQVDKLCKLVPNNPANPVTLAQAIEGEPKLQEARDSEPMVARLLEIAQKLEGLYRHASTHAAGMVIGDRPLDELVPLYRDPKSSFPITQFNWKLVEAAGLVKFDFLGLKTLTVLQKAVALIKRGRGIDIDLLKLCRSTTRKTYELLAKADTVGVFQLEGAGDARQPQAAQARPLRGHHRHGGALPARPHGQHPDLHQPQARRGARRLPASHAGADPEGDLRRHHLPGAGDADRPGDGRLLARRGRHAAQRHGQERQGRDGQAAGRFVARRGQEGREARRRRLHLRAGRQVRRLRLQQEPRGRLRGGQLSHGLPEGQLPRGVPGRLHDARHAGNTDKLAMYTSEAKKSGIAILPPCVNASEVDFLAEPPAGQSAAPSAIRWRRSRTSARRRSRAWSPSAAPTGRFKDLSDFAARCNTKALNKRALETLAAAGAFDALEANRALVHGNVEQMLAFANRLATNAAQGTDDLFGGGADGAAADGRARR